MRVLFVGLGGIGQRHLRNLRLILGSEVQVSAYRVRGLSTTVNDRLEIESGVNFEEKYGVKVHRQLDEALAVPPDAVFICNPTRMHIPVALAAAKAGAALFIEKPLSDSLDGVEALRELVAARGLVTLVAYQLRFHPLLRGLKAIVTDDSFGRPVAVRADVAEYLPSFHPYEDYRQLYASRQALGGGVVVSQIHEFDYLFSLFGLPARIFAVGGRLSRLEIDVEDVASVLMEYDGGGGRRFPVHLHQDYLQKPPSRTCMVLGEGGKVMIDFHALTLTYFDEKGAVRSQLAYPKFNRNQLFIDEMRHFLSCVAGKEAPIVPLESGLQSLRMALAAKQSIASGQVVELGKDLS
jgi:predicted dehydrogenase